MVSARTVEVVWRVVRVARLGYSQDGWGSV